MSTQHGVSGSTAAGRPRTSMSFEPVDTHRSMTILSFAGVVAAGLVMLARTSDWTGPRGPFQVAVRDYYVP
jgi:hypothetical protein